VVTLLLNLYVVSEADPRHLRNGKQVRDGRGPRQMVVGTRRVRIAGQSS
jgi:hypothetical protein